MEKRPSSLTIAACIGCFVLGLIAWRMIATEEPEDVAETTEEATESPRQRASTTRDQGARAVQPEGQARRPPLEKGSRRLADRESWNELAKAIETARSSRSEKAPAGEGATPDAPASTAAAAEDEPPRGVLSKEYIQEAVQETVPLIRECYDMALERNSKLSGRLVATFTIAAEEEVGGIVERAGIEADDGLKDEGLLECIHETVYTIEFPPPEKGGVVEVNYPFVFNNAPLTE